MLQLLVLSVGLLASTSPNTCGSPTIDARRPQLGIVSGQVVDSSGAPIPVADIVLKATSGRRLYKTADQNGCYSFTADGGDYTVLARAPAFRIGSASLHIVPQRAQVKTIRLDVGSCTNCVQVQGAATFNACIRDSEGFVANSEVTLTPLNSPRHSAPITVHLDGWGCGWLQPLAGMYQLDVVTPGFLSLRKTLLLRDGQDSPMTTLIIQPTKR
jgi:Carboxypeptidase regulatory-like domain